jgi:AAA domain
MPDPLTNLMRSLSAEGKTESEIRDAIRRQVAHSDAFHRLLGRPGELRRRLAQIAEGVITCVTWPWAALAEQCPSLLPGTVTVVVGVPGATKSFCMLQCMDYWLSRDYSVKCAMLERSRAWHLHRYLAQVSGRPEFLSMGHVQSHPDEVDSALDQYAVQIDRMAGAIDIPSGIWSYDDAKSWMLKICNDKQPPRIIIVDPLTKADPGGLQWEADRAIVAFCEKLAGQFGCSIILVVHPKKDNSMPAIENIFGGASYSRHVQAVIWLSRFEFKNLTVKTWAGREQVACNRVMHLLKVSDGLGQGKHIGYEFSGKTLRLEEKGIVVREKKE